MPTKDTYAVSQENETTKKVVKPRKPRTKKTAETNGTAVKKARAPRKEKASSDEVITPVAEKPAPMVIGASGFQGDVYGNDPNQEHIDWNRLAAFPPFQMFACEKTGNATDSIEFWILGFIHESVTKQGEKPTFNAYCTWHDNKGYWKNETVYGDLKGN